MIKYTFNSYCIKANIPYDDYQVFKEFVKGKSWKSYDRKSYEAWHEEWKKYIKEKRSRNL